MYITNHLRFARVRRRGDAPLGRWHGDRLGRSRLRQRIATRCAWHAARRRDPADFFHHCAALDRVYTASIITGGRRQLAGSPPAPCPLTSATLICGQRTALPAAGCEGAREGGVCHHVARRRARGAARRARPAAGNPPPPAAQSARHARAQAPHARRVHERARLERARLERERLERERPNAARSGAPRAARLRRPAAAQQQLPQQPRVRRPLVAP